MGAEESKPVKYSGETVWSWWIYPFEKDYGQFRNCSVLALTSFPHV